VPPSIAPSYAAGMRIALCQMPISPDPAINLERVAEAMAAAARQGADLAVFPEATQARFGSDLRAVAEPLDGAFGSGLAELAREAGVALVAGVFEPAPDGRVYNTAVAYAASGDLVAAYRKIHLFDSLGERESALVAPGSEPVVADLAGIRTGFATCYDLRFPELFRTMVARRAELIVVPGAWAAGLFKEEHWVTLVRARAIEDTVWVAAAGQVPDPASPPTRAPTGVGRSMLVDPMGTVRADLGLWPQVTVADLDSAMTARVRAVLPCLEHRRDDVFGPADPAGRVGSAGPAAAVSGSVPATEWDAARSG
jgi:deaminated glutathione amidase